MVQPDERHPADINTEIQSLRGDIDGLSRKQDNSNIVQTQSWFIALGIAVLGIAVAIVSREGLDATMALSALFLLVIGVVLTARSRQLASLVWKWELRQNGFNVNQTQRRPNVPSTLKVLATVAAWILFILGCLCLLALVIYVIILAFNLISLTLSPTVIAALLGLGIIYFLMSLIAIRIRRGLE
ncbi:MAG: hypothetical protein H8E40_06080 [Chloroflexi bacterium]|nr:hypothetical protein [Chloroflexota bacterium]